ncbi:MAG: hypothetical protein ACKVIY_16330, partial [Acidimicrobiales bacterium]
MILRASELGLSKDDVVGQVILSEIEVADGSAIVTTVQQTINGIPIHGAVSTIVVDARGQLVRIGDRFVRSASRRATSSTP